MIWCEITWWRYTSTTWRRSLLVRGLKTPHLETWKWSIFGLVGVSAPILDFTLLPTEWSPYPLPYFIRFFLYIDYIDSILTTCMINYSCLIMTRLYFFTYIVVIYIFLIDTSTWLCISLFLLSNEFITWTFGINVDMTKVWISYNIINVVCIWIIWFATVDMWGNSSSSHLIRLEWNIPPLFFSSWRRHHDHVFYFCEIARQYNCN